MPSAATSSCSSSVGSMMSPLPAVSRWIVWLDARMVPSRVWWSPEAMQRGTSVQVKPGTHENRMRNEITYDVVIAGLGAMGSAAAFHLARRGVRVLGLDRFAPPHAFGSSHGRTRIIREAYYEHPLYVPLVRRAYELWAELEEESGRRISLRTGGLMIGPPDGTLVAGARRSALEHGLPFHELSAAELRERVPAFQPADDMVAIEEPRAGILFPETCIGAHLEAARRAGADLRLD